MKKNRASVLESGFFTGFVFGFGFFLGVIALIVAIHIADKTSDCIILLFNNPVYCETAGYSHV